MEWKVTIENKPNQRIVVRFVPKEELVYFIGQYKPHNREWVDFSEETYPMKIDLEEIQKLLSKVYDKMKERLAAYNNIAEGFTIIKEIGIEEDNSDENIEIKNTSENVYGEETLNDSQL